MYTLLIAVVFLFIGWNLEQPEFAKTIQNTLVQKWKELRSSAE